MKPKEAGYVLSIDQASNAAGVSLWHNGSLVATTVLTSQSPADPFSRRVQHQVPQLTAFLDKHVPQQFKIEKVVFEGVRSHLVLITVGAFLTCPRIDARISERGSFVPSFVWKKHAQLRGAKGELKNVKGVVSLQQSGFDCVLHGITSDDVADSIMQYRAWADR